MCVFLKHGYCNNHFKLVKMDADSYLIGILIINREIFVSSLGNCYYYKLGRIITNRGSYYKPGQLSQIRAQQFFFCLQGRSFLITCYLLYSASNLENKSNHLA